MDPQYGPGGPFGLLQQQGGVRATGQGCILGAVEPVKLNLDLGDFARARSGAAMEDTGFVLEAHMSEFGET